MAEVSDERQRLLVKAEVVAEAFDVPLSWVRAKTRSGECLELSPWGGIGDTT
jgi:hypothetical protein